MDIAGTSLSASHYCTKYTGDCNQHNLCMYHAKAAEPEMVSAATVHFDFAGTTHYDADCFSNRDGYHEFPAVRRDFILAVSDFHHVSVKGSMEQNVAGKRLRTGFCMGNHCFARARTVHDPDSGMVPCNGLYCSAPEKMEAGCHFAGHACSGFCRARIACENVQLL